MNFDNLITENVVLNIVKDKLRHDENVLSVSGCSGILCDSTQLNHPNLDDALQIAHTDMFCCFQLCETYQVVGGEYKNRLLALVAQSKTSAIFAFASTKWPPESFSDLTIESVYPMNADFKLDSRTIYSHLMFIALATNNS